LFGLLDQFLHPECYGTAVAVLAILHSKVSAFPPSTVIIEQYRPPIGKYIIGNFTPQTLPLTTLTVVANLELPAGMNK